MREFIRHPSSIPVVIEPKDSTEKEIQTLNDVSLGGLSCVSSRYIDRGTEVNLKIEHVDPAFEITGIVTWCKPKGDVYDLGVEYHVGKDKAYSLRMVEQICHIEHYRKEIRRTEGRRLTSEEAAMEWIEKCASEFPE